MSQCCNLIGLALKPASDPGQHHVFRPTVPLNDTEVKSHQPNMQNVTAQQELRVLIKP